MKKKIKSKRNVTNAALYPNLKKLGIKVYNKPVPYVLFDDIDLALEKHKINHTKFDTLFGHATVPMIENVKHLTAYPWTVESVLEKLINKK